MHPYNPPRLGFILHLVEEHLEEFGVRLGPESGFHYLYLPEEVVVDVGPELPHWYGWCIWL